ncbi:MAG: ABC transporter ATP-binding protein [Thermodesulfobacteriota bacterium]|jgi:molybdate transport system ATP-binding protein
MIEIHVEKDLGNFSLNLSLSLQKGLTVLFGPSGSGKTLTLHTISGLVKPDSGIIRVNGVVYFDKEGGVDLPIHRRQVGYVFQEPSLFPHMTVFENISYGISGLPSGERKRRVNDMIERMRLGGLEKNLPHQISGGQKQRVAMGRALAASPLLLLLDEPFASLDNPVRGKLRLDLLRIVKEDRTPLIFVTHDVEEAFILADEVVVLNDGRVEQTGTKEDIFYRPQTHKVAKFFGVKNIFRGKILDVRPEEGKMMVWVEQKGFQASIPCRKGAREGEWVRFCIRPEEIMILKEDRPVKKNLKANIFTGQILRIVEKGSEHTLFFKQGQNDYDFEISISNLAYRSLGLREGQLVRVALKWESIWLLPEEKREGSTNSWLAAEDRNYDWR